MTIAARPPWRREFAAALVLAAAATLCLVTGVVHRLDLVLYDLLIAFDRPAPRAEVAIVAIDERSLQQLGRWPWPRTTHARLIDRLREAQTRAVALQVIFAEPADPDADRALVQAVARHGRVVLPVFPERDGLVPGGSLNATLPLPELARVARLGHVDTELDDDGLVRGVYLKAGIDDGAGGGRLWSHLGLAMIEVGLAESSPEFAGRIWRGERRPEVRPDLGAAAASNRGARAGAAWVRDVRALVPFAPTAFAVVSYADVLSDPRAAAALRGKLVLVGATAAGTGDELATPVQRGGARMPGVEFNAHVASALLQDRLIAPLPFAPTLALTLAVPWLVLWGSSRVRRTWVPAVTLGGAALVLVLAAVLLSGADHWFAAASSLAGVLLSYPLWAWLRMQRDAEALAVEKTQLNATLQSIGDAVITTDTAGRVVFLNPVAEALIGVPLAQARERHLDELVSFEDDHGTVRRPAREVLLPATQAALAGGVHGRLTVRPGYTRVVRVCGRPVRAAPGAQVGGVVLAVTDLSDLAAMTARIEHQATHDALTGLPNRLLLRDRVEQALARARRAPPEAREVAVLLIDLDHFKRVNDSLGHSEGDVLLREVAHRLSATVRAGDTVARWGGDEFVVLLDGIPGRAAAAARAQALCEALRAPHGGTNGDAGTGASIGVALFPNDGDDADSLFRHADAAMYAAKAAGRNMVSFYSAQMHEIANERLALERALRGAVARNEFELYYQPQVNLEDGRIVGAEALLRWRHPDAGLLPPKHFIELAEETGLIQDIGAWVIREACRVLRTWRAAGLPRVTVAVNVSPRQLAHPQFEATVRAALDREDIGESALKLEITESVLATDVERSAALLARLRTRGVAVAIDDFGVGYSSLRYLKQFPVSELKIDPLFVNRAALTSQDAAIIDTIVALARGLDLTVIAEGIETEEQLGFLRERGCRFGQGFLFARPLPLFEVARLIAAGDPLPLR